MPTNRGRKRQYNMSFTHFRFSKKYFRGRMGKRNIFSNIFLTFIGRSIKGINIIANTNPIA
jgi:hypothetical protein